MRVFLDSIRLGLGQRFVDDIMQAMLHSRVVCPIISADAVRRMQQIEEVAREQSSTVYIICSTSEKDLQGNEIMKKIERICASNPQLFMVSHRISRIRLPTSCKPRTCFLHLHGFCDACSIGPGDHAEHCSLTRFAVVG